MDRPICASCRKITIANGNKKKQLKNMFSVISTNVLFRNQLVYAYFYKRFI